MLWVLAEDHIKDGLEHILYIFTEEFPQYNTFPVRVDTCAKYCNPQRSCEKPETLLFISWQHSRELAAAYNEVCTVVQRPFHGALFKTHCQCSGMSFRCEQPQPGYGRCSNGVKGESV